MKTTPIVKIKKANLKKGGIYLTKSGSKILYLGERYIKNKLTKLYHDKVYLYTNLKYINNYQEEYVLNYVTAVGVLPVLVEEKELMFEKYLEIMQAYDKKADVKVNKDQGRAKNTFTRITDPSVLNLDKVKHYENIEDLYVKSKDKKISLHTMRYDRQTGSWNTTKTKQLRVKISGEYNYYDLDSQPLKDVFTTHEIYKKTTKIIL